MALPRLAVVIPTFNERDNVLPVIEALEAVLAGESWEVVFVDDDSTDGTVEILREATAEKPHVRCIHRIGRRGLASAVVEGILCTSAPFVAVMDADLQHDERLLAPMLAALDRGDADLVVGTRFAEGGSVGDWDPRRLRASRLAAWLSRLVLGNALTDPMSGYFMLRREGFDAALRRVSGGGYKILLDLVASSPRTLRVVELPYRFRERRAGESKLDALVVWEYGMLLAGKLLGGRVPVRFLSFALVGASGVAVHFAVLRVLLGYGLTFPVSQSAATLAAMTTNFALNNTLTYRDRRLRGAALARGLLAFYLVCSLGALANVGVASVLFAQNGVWWLAGAAGVLVGAIWNYWMSSLLAWRVSPGWRRS